MSKAIGEVRMKGEDEYNTMYSSPRQENTKSGQQKMRKRKTHSPDSLFYLLTIKSAASTIIETQNLGLQKLIRQLCLTVFFFSPVMDTA